MSEKFKVIAIDGGAASGKSSTSKAIAMRNNYLHVDTGAHYRSITYSALAKKLNPDDEKLLQNFLDQLKMETKIEDRESLMVVDGVVPDGSAIRSEAVNGNVSKFAAVEEVRSAVKAYQQNQVSIARANGFDGIIMDGRDIGTIILPNADLKVFLYADEETKMKRRLSDGQVDAIAQRDKLDSTRKTAPLVPAEDSLQIDNSNMTLDQVVERVEQELKRIG